MPPGEPTTPDDGDKNDITTSENYAKGVMIDQVILIKHQYESIRYYFINHWLYYMQKWDFIKKAVKIQNHVCCFLFGSSHHSECGRVLFSLLSPRCVLAETGDC